MLRFVLAVVLLFASLGATPHVDRISDIAYVADGQREHQLDLYLPTVSAATPLVVFVHGGAFIDGDRREYRVVGESLASQGLATAIVSYRLYPRADAFGSMKDVATAVQWLLDHEQQYGLAARRVLLAGHSAGGQIVAQLATDGALLGNDASRVCGAISDAGIYDVRDLSGEPDWMQRADEKIYGATPDERAKVSPQMYVSATAAPVLAACGTEDDPDACGRALRFVRALKAAGGSAIVLREVGADHLGMLRDLIDPRDALNARLHAMADDCSSARPSTSSG